MQMVSINEKQNRQGYLLFFAVLFYCVGASGTTLEATHNSQAAKVMNFEEVLVTQPSPEVEKPGGIESPNKVKRKQVCRVPRTGFLAHLSAERGFDNSEKYKGFSTFEQRIYRTRVGKLSRPALRGHPANQC